MPTLERTWTTVGEEITAVPEPLFTLAGECLNCGITRHAGVPWFSCDDWPGASCSQTAPPPRVNRNMLAAAIDALEWQPVGDGPLDLPAMPGLGLKAMIAELGLPKVSAVAIGDQQLGRTHYALYGVRSTYRNGTAQIYAVDRGSDIIPVASDFTPKE